MKKNPAFAIVFIVVLMLIAFLLAPHMGWGTVKGPATHGLYTWNPIADTWEQHELPPDAHVFVIDAVGDPVPAVAFSHSEDGQQLLLVPVDEYGQYLQSEIDKGHVPAPPEPKAPEVK